MPAVSIIVPVYNTGQYVAECLASIVRQTLRDIEVICIDDASADDSLAVCRAFASDDSRIKVVSLAANEGVASARNRGLNLATGDFVMFMDSDDWYPFDETVEHLYRAAVDNGVSIAGGAMSEFDVTTGELFDDYRDLGHLALYNFEKACVMEYRDWQGDYGFTRFIYERKLIEENGIRFPNLVRHEDPVFFVRAMIAAGRFYALPEVVYRYRVKHKSYELSAKAIDDAVQAHVELLVLAEENDYSVLKGYVTETLRWYLSTQTPEVRSLHARIEELEKSGDVLRDELDALHGELDALRGELSEVYASKSFKLGNAVAMPWRILVYAILGYRRGK